LKTDEENIAFIVDHFAKSIGPKNASKTIFDTIFSSYEGDFALFLTSLHFPKGALVSSEIVGLYTNIPDLFQYTLTLTLTLSVCAVCM
jgi:hypothetical protein